MFSKFSKPILGSFKYNFPQRKEIQSWAFQNIYTNDYNSIPSKLFTKFNEYQTLPSFA